MGHPYHGPLNLRPKHGESKIIVYGYIPNLSVCITAVVLFTILLLLHIYHFVRYRRTTRVFQGLIILGCVMEVTGYSARMASHFRPFVINYFIINYLMIVCAPISYSAAIYLALADIIKKMPKDKQYSPLSPRALVATFVVADVVTIVTQLTGASLVGVANDVQSEGKKPPVTPDQANTIVLAGLAVQSVCFAVFLLIFGLFLNNLRKAAPRGIRPPVGLLAVLGGTALLIFLRTLFRLSETAQGLLGFLMVHEQYFVGLELAPVVVAIALWASFPFGAGIRSMDAPLFEVDSPVSSMSGDSPVMDKIADAEKGRNSGLY